MGVPDLHPHEQQTVFAEIDLRAREDIATANSAILSAELVLFTKPGCPFCKGAFETLQDTGRAFKIIEVTRSQKRGLQYPTGQTSLPSFWVNGSYCGGCNDGTESWHGVKPMVANGVLQKMLPSKATHGVDNTLPGA